MEEKFDNKSRLWNFSLESSNRIFHQCRLAGSWVAFDPNHSEFLLPGFECGMVMQPSTSIVRCFGHCVLSLFHVGEIQAVKARYGC